MQEKYKIGYIDEQPTQFQKVRRKLQNDFDVIGYDIPVGLHIEDLLNQVYQSDIDLLLVDFLLNEKGILIYNGDEVVRKYEEIRPKFPILIFTNFDDQAFPQVDNPNIIYDKKMMQENPEKLIEALKKNIILYQNYIRQRKDRIHVLLEKDRQNQLNAKEKDEFLRLQVELANLDKRSQEVPVQLLQPEALDKLSATRKEAEQFLQSLINKKER